MKKYLVTGVAGFIGMHCAEALMDKGYFVVGVDDLNNYYDPNLKKARLQKIQSRSDSYRFLFIKANIADLNAMKRLFFEHELNGVVHLAAQAGVRYSLKKPQDYVDSNLMGFVNILEGMRYQREQFDIAATGMQQHLVYASSSSVYGANKKVPFSEADPVDRPLSLYAASKKANELMAYSYSHLFGIPATGLRFFTVYGPWGRPDMSYFIFTEAILKNKSIDVFNYGEMKRDFTYIDDVIKSILLILDLPPNSEPFQENFGSQNGVPHRILNIGNHRPENLINFIYEIERALDKRAKVSMQPMQPGDVLETYADIAALQMLTGFIPNTGLREGIQRFVEWYRNYYSI